MLSMDRYEEIGIHLQHGGMTDDEIDEYFAHHGVKGMKWGVRSAKSAGRGAAIAGKAVGRGAKATGKFVWNHKKAVVTVAAGTAIVGGFLKTTYFPSTKFKVDEKAFNKQYKDMMSMHGKLKVANISEAAREAAINTRASDVIRGPKGSISRSATASKFMLSPENIKRLTGV